MNSLVAYNFAVVVVLTTHSMIFTVNGQLTMSLDVCENGDSSNNIAVEIHQLFVDAIHQQVNEQIQYVHELLNTSLQQMQNQQDKVMISLLVVDRRSQNQEQDIQNLNASLNLVINQQSTLVTSLQAIDRSSQKQEQDMRNLNVSLQQMKNQQSTLGASLQAVDRSSQKQEQDMRNLNVSLQQMKNQQSTLGASLQAVDRSSQKQEQDMRNLNVSLQQMKNQQSTLGSSLQAVDRRSQEQDIYVKQVPGIQRLLNASKQQMKTQHDNTLRSLEAIDRRFRDSTKDLWKLAIAIGIDLERGPILPPIFNNWVVLMHRFDGSLNFNRDWEDYRNGFGNRGGEFWLGNENIHRLTNRFFFTLRIELYIGGSSFYAEYTNFHIESEFSKYKLRLGGYSGDAGDSLLDNAISGVVNLNACYFSTHDADNDRYPGGNCASEDQGGWWFNYCQYACLTCSYGNKFKWYGIGSLRGARMMIKTK